jgi:tetratricopeptide (TPR) repeat protein
VRHGREFLWYQVKQICKRVAEFIVKMLLHRFGLSIEVLFLFCLGVHAADIPSLVRKAKPAVVQVIASDANWAPVRTGTGFFISADGELLTNFHVVRGATHISARTDKGSIFVFERAIAESADSDVALLKFQATDVDFLKIGTSTNAVEGETVLVIGSPEGLQGTVSNGIVSAFRENRAYIQITAPVSPGSSGSPVLDETGQVIGMATLISKEGQNLNFAISAEVIENAIVQSEYKNALEESKKSNYEVAIKYDSYAIEGKPDFADAYENRAFNYNALKLYDKALADSSTAIKLKPNDAETYVDRANANAGLGRFDDAIADFAEALHLNPLQPSSGQTLAEAYRDSGKLSWAFDDYCSAIADFSETIRLSPNSRSAYEFRGMMYKAIGKLKEAQTDFAKARELDPGS